MRTTAPRRAVTSRAPGRAATAFRRAVPSDRFSDCALAVSIDAIVPTDRILCVSHAGAQQQHEPGDGISR